MLLALRLNCRDSHRDFVSVCRCIRGGAFMGSVNELLTSGRKCGCRVGIMAVYIHGNALEFSNWREM
jgi:hypothetical protein